MASNQLLCKVPNAKARNTTDLSKSRIRSGADVQRVLKGFKERKHHYTQFSTGSPVNCDLNGIFMQFTGIAQGNGDSDREGDRITPDTLEIKYEVVCSVLSGGATTNLIRVIVFRWNGDNLTGPTAVSDIVGVTSGQPNTPLSHINQDNLNGKNLEILHDDLISLNTYQPSAVREIKLRLPSEKTIQYLGGSTTSGYGHLYILAFSDDGAVPWPTFNCVGLLQFYD